MIPRSRSSSRSRFFGWLAVWTLGICGAVIPRASADELRVVAGVVVDEAGNPVSGAVVESIAPKLGEPVQTDAEGRFTLPDPKRSSWFQSALLARGENGRLGFTVANQKEFGAVRLVMKPARSLRVRVVDATKRPIPGAEVVVLAEYGMITNGETDAEGNWTALVPADIKSWNCFARKPNVGFDYAQAERARGSTEPPFPLPDELTLTLDGTRPPLRVKAVGLRDEPLSGVAVRLWLVQRPGQEAQLNFSGSSGKITTTGVDGTAILDWLPERVEEGYSIVTQSDRYQSIDHAVFMKAGSTDSEVKIIHVPMERISGRVVDASGKPVAGVLVNAQGQGGSSDYFRNETLTDADGRYHFDAKSECAYILMATKADRAAPYRADLVLRADHPLENVDFKLGPATRLRGRLTLGSDAKPVAAESITVVIDRGSIPDELKRPGDRFYHAMQAYQWCQTDTDGRYEIFLGPGEYKLQGVTRVDPIKLNIPDANPPAELVRDIVKPRPDRGPFQLTVVDPDGKPVADAKIDGSYVSANNSVWFDSQKASQAGIASFQRSLDPMIVHAESPDRTLAAMTQFEVEATEGRIVLGPTATATGRLVDPQGQPIADTKFQYGMRIHVGPSKNSAFSWLFGGMTQTDAAGRYHCNGLVVGQSYDYFVQLEGQSNTPSVSRAILPTQPGPIALADVTLDLAPPKPYAPPTAAERTRQSFEASKKSALDARLTTLLAEAKREYTQPMILFGDKESPTCVDLFRLFNERSDPETTVKTMTPIELRWEFELASLNSTQADVAAFASGLGIDSKTAAPVLVVLDDVGKPTASYPLRPGPDGKLDSPTLAGFLLAHKLATRDAQAMLTAAQAEAKASDKRVFLIFSASWCGPCRLLARFLDSAKAELGPHYIFVKLDISRDDRIKDLRDRYPAGDSSGVPWYVILDGDGRPIIDSNAKKSGEDEEPSNLNIGFPSDKPAVDHFLKMIRQTAPRIGPDALETLRSKLEARP